LPVSIVSRRCAIPLGLAACVLALVAAVALAATPQASPTRSVTRLSATQVAYLTHCGGCHGIEGISAPGAVPTLRGLTGSFLCTRQGREFIIRLPDVGLSTLSDRELTDVMNFVVFDIGAPVAGGRPTLPYTVAEVARLRRQPLTNTGLTAYRNQVVAGLAAKCQVPAALHVYAARVASSR
jgi:hypothetical protein